MTQLLTAWRPVAVICAVAALSLSLAARVASGPRGALVHVRWAASVDASARQKLEARFRLADGEHLEGSTWRYDLVDPSPDTIRALVRHPAVADTHHIDRSRFALDNAERTVRRGRIAYGSVLVAAADDLATALATLGALLTLVPLARTIFSGDRWVGPRNLLFRAEDRLFRAEPRLLPYAFLTILGVAVYAVALWFPPTNGDDLLYLSSVSTIGNPLAYFIQDHGHGNELYRPLTPVSMWVVYQIFGVWALPNQTINLILHMANVFLLYRIIQRAQPDRALAMLLAAVFMISNYTFLAATWTSDRPMLLTALFLFLLINHLARESSGGSSGASVRIFSVAAFSVLALMSKESGLVVPAVGLLFALTSTGAKRLTPQRRLSLAFVTSAIIGLYIAWRFLIFGSDFASYSQDGYMFLGRVHYEDSRDLPEVLRYFNYVENVIKNGLAPILPVFAVSGALLTRQSLLTYLPVIVSTALLFALAVSRRHLSRLQWIALIVIPANALTHFALFRFRLHYLSHAAFCLFVASSPLLGNGHGHHGRTLAAKTLAVIALVGSTLWTSSMLNAYTLDRNREVDRLRTDGIQRYGRVVEQVLQRYKGF
jgi:hypothetical protein